MERALAMHLMMAGGELRGRLHHRPQRTKAQPQTGLQPLDTYLPGINRYLEDPHFQVCGRTGPPYLEQAGNGEVWDRLGQQRGKLTSLLMHEGS